MRIHTLAFALAAALAAGACSNKLGGDLTINGAAFAPSSCRSGAVYGFVGVEVSGKSGYKLRLMQTPTGEAAAVVFAPGATVGAELGRCGTLRVDTQNSTINDVKNVEGKANLACETDGMKLAGTLTFKNCH